MHVGWAELVVWVPSVIQKLFSNFFCLILFLVSETGSRYVAQSHPELSKVSCIQLVILLSQPSRYHAWLDTNTLSYFAL